MSESFQGAVVEIDVGYFNIMGRQTFSIDDESVVLGSDLNPAGRQILDRVIGAMVTEFQLFGFTPQRQSQNLVAETDSKDRLLAQ